MNRSLHGGLNLDPVADEVTSLISRRGFPPIRTSRRVRVPATSSSRSLECASPLALSTSSLVPIRAIRGNSCLLFPAFRL